MKVCGVDPGSAGAIAFIDGMKSTVYDMPMAKAFDNQKVVSFAGVVKLIAGERPDLVVVEWQQVQAITGKKTAFIMGRNYQSLLNAVKMAVATMEIPTIIAKPQEWKKTLGLIAPKGTSIKDKKKMTADFVQGVFPKQEIYTKRGALKDGRSDALAIAEYGRRKYA